MNSYRKNSDIRLAKSSVIIPAGPFIEAAEKANLAKVPRIQKWIRAVAASNSKSLAEPLAKYLHLKSEGVLGKTRPRQFSCPQEIGRGKNSSWLEANCCF